MHNHIYCKMRMKMNIGTSFDKHMEPQQTIASPATLGAANGGPLE
jgi:hypothetical protein